MAKFDVDVEGITYEVDAPDENTAWKWANVTHRQSKPSEPAAIAPKSTNMAEDAKRWFLGDPNATIPQRIAANPITRFAVGAASPILGGAQLLEKGVTTLVNPIAKALGASPIPENASNSLSTFEEMKKAGGAEGMDVAGIAGNMLSPASLGAAKLLGPATTAGARIGQGAAMGAGMGAAQPVTTPDYWGTKGEQVAGGALVGAAIPAAWEGAKTIGRGVRNVVQPYMGQWGADQAAGRLANVASGSNRDAVINELRAAQPIVAGSNPTAGQAAVPANSAEFAALQKMASAEAPSQYFGAGGIEGAQNQARIQALRTIGQTPQALQSAEQARSAAANVDYGNAYAQAIKADPRLAQLMQNPYVKDAIPDALKLAEAKGISPKTDLTQFLHFVKISLDKMSNRVGETALANTERAAVQDAKQNLISWLGQKNPVYDTARSNFAAASKPINQMQVGQEIESRLVPALSEDAKQKAAAYAQALRDASGTIKRATGQPRFDSLDQIMTPPQMQTLGNIQKDLARNAAYEEMAQKGMPAARKAIGNAVPEIPPTGMFSPLLSVARGAYNRVTGHATDKIMSDLAQRMQDPKKMAEIMQNAKPYERKALVDALMKYQAAGGAAAVSQGVQ